MREHNEYQRQYVQAGKEVWVGRHFPATPQLIYDTITPQGSRWHTHVARHDELLGRWACNLIEESDL